MTPAQGDRFVLNGHPATPEHTAQVTSVDRGTVVYEYGDWPGQPFDMPADQFARAFRPEETR
jgi:hypothetical protein